MSSSSNGSDVGWSVTTNFFLLLFLTIKGVWSCRSKKKKRCLACQRQAIHAGTRKFIIDFSFVAWLQEIVKFLTRNVLSLQLMPLELLVGVEPTCRFCSCLLCVGRCGWGKAQFANRLLSPKKKITLTNDNVHENFIYTRRRSSCKSTSRRRKRSNCSSRRRKSL